jgi:hypothetical protein
VAKSDQGTVTDVTQKTCYWQTAQRLLESINRGVWLERFMSKTSKI